MASKPLPHAWTWGAGYHCTRDAECACGAEVHDVTPTKPRRTTKYATEPGGELSDKLPPCTRADDERHNHELAHTAPPARGVEGVR